MEKNSDVQLSHKISGNFGYTGDKDRLSKPEKFL